jgi:hypothetical protein
MNFRVSILPTLAVLLLGCSSPEIIDDAQVCVSTDELDGQLRLIVDASGNACAADHKGASFECTITTDGFDAHVETVFQDGKDPNDACIGPIMTTCEVLVEPGTYTIEFDGEEVVIVVPDGDQACFAGALGDTEG